MEWSKGSFVGRTKEREGGKADGREKLGGGGPGKEGSSSKMVRTGARGESGQRAKGEREGERQEGGGELQQLAVANLGFAPE